MSGAGADGFAGGAPTRITPYSAFGVSPVAKASVNFDGATSQLDVLQPSAAAWLSGTEWSVVFHLRPDADAGWLIYSEDDAAATNDLIIELGDNSIDGYAVKAIFGTDNDNELVFAEDLIDANRIVIVTYNTTRGLYLYISNDAGSYASDESPITQASRTFADPDVLHIGNSFVGGAVSYEGLMSQIAVFPTALSTTQIDHIMGLSGIQPN